MQNPKRHLVWVGVWAALWAAFAWLVPPAVAQDEDASSQGEIAITCPSKGVGGVMRRGDWVGLKLGINDSGAKAREIIVQISCPDADNDPTLFERSVTTNPGTVLPLWMYVRLRSNFENTSVLTVTAYEAVEGSGPVREGERPPLTTGKILGVTRIVRPVLTDLRADGMIGIVGSKTMGLRAYEGAEDRREFLSAFGGHERTRVVGRLDVDALPDRWMGLAPFEFLVWSDPLPTKLDSEHAAALREWVQRGGHLIVVLPTVAQVWTDETNNPLADISPRVTVRRQEGVSLEPYHALIDRREAKQFAMPDKEVVQTFTPLAGAAPEEAVGIIAAAPEKGTPSKEWVVVRRLAGSGMVTLVGLDLNSRWMDQHGEPDVELFWHRVLGRRGAMLVQPDRNTNSFIRSRQPATIDSFIPSLIAKRGQAAAGVLLGFVVFIAYWLLAGPPGFAVLKKMGWGRHGWVAFVAAAGVFTAVAWGGATAIRPGRTEAKHLTILDHVYGQTIDHARGWFSLLVPDYGQLTVTVGEPTGRERTRFHNALSPWEPADGGGEGFTDARAYRMDCKNPDQATIPTRATVKQLQVDWAGAPPWKMPHPLSADPSTPDGVLKLGEEKGDSFAIGTIVHDLPGPLTDVCVIVNRGQKSITRSRAGSAPGTSLLADLSAFYIGSWKPGAESALRLEDATRRKDGTTTKTTADDFLNLADKAKVDGEGGEDVRGDALKDRFTAISFYSQLQPPDLTGTGRVNYNNPSEHVAQRIYTHTMDLSAWLTEPCIIVIGQYGAAQDDAPTPIPLYGGNGASARPLATAGRTLVRWIYPLPARAPEYQSSTDTAPADPVAPSGDAG